ncbi:MAG: c-type cytochrome biogenesis protein CcmI [Gammaproteobacteria bacterium]|nr:c-type cytochrome biogenesis protein CcmI [Gammaproteobacteria bacterium]
MSTFWIINTVFILIALAFVLIPLFKPQDEVEVSRDEQNIAIAKEKLAALKKSLDETDITQQEYDDLRGELENSLAIDLEHEKSVKHHTSGSWLIVLLLVSIPAGSFLFYEEIGSPDLLDPKAKYAEMKRQTPTANMSISEIIETVKKRLANDPNDSEGWYVLGRTFMSIQKYNEAATAYQRTYDLVGEDPDVILALADALAMTNAGSMLGKPEVLVKRALDLDANNTIALWLAGLAAEQRNEPNEAFALWTRLLPLLVNEPSSYNEVKAILVDIKGKNPTLPELPFALEETAPNTMASQSVEPANTPNTSSADMVQVSLSISIHEDFKSKLSGNEQVFIYAKAVTGPPMPLAAKKLKVSDLPIQIILSEADAMMPQLTLATVDAFTVGARVSFSGNPIPQKGDYFVEVSPLTKESKETVSLEISKILN